MEVSELAGHQQPCRAGLCHAPTPHYAKQPDPDEVQALLAQDTGILTGKSPCPSPHKGQTQE